MPYRLVVFDWDGTLIDSEARIVSCFQAAAADLGLPLVPDSAVRNIIGLGLSQACGVLLPHLSVAGQLDVAERYRHHFLSAHASPSKPFPGVPETLRWLHDRGYLLAVATGKSRRGLNRELEETGFGSWFVATRCADESHSKPHPAMLLEILEELAVAPGEALMIGDTEYDMEMAHRAGVDRVAVSYGVHDMDRLQRWSPQLCLDHLPGLMDWLVSHEP